MAGFVVPTAHRPESPKVGQSRTDAPVSPLSPLLVTAVIKEASPPPPLSVLREARQAIPQRLCRQVEVVGRPTKVEVVVRLPARVRWLILKARMRPLQTAKT